MSKRMGEYVVGDYVYRYYRWDGIQRLLIMDVTQTQSQASGRTTVTLLIRDKEPYPISGDPAQELHEVNQWPHPHYDSVETLIAHYEAECKARYEEQIESLHSFVKKYKRNIR